MFGVNDLDITVYLVGTDEDDAQENAFFDSWGEAESYRKEHPGTKVFSVEGRIDFTTIEEVT